MRTAVSLTLLSGLVLSSPTLAATLENKNTLRQQAEQVCYNNVMAFCNEAVPDEDKVKACMKQNHARLDPDCRTIFDKGMAL